MATRCPMCHGDAKRNGHTSKGTQLWKCRACGATFTRGKNSDTKLLREFLEWLFGSTHMKDMPGNGRNFRKKIQAIWELWPTPYVTGVYHPVVEVDGIYLSRKTVILIATTPEGIIIAWYLAKSENARSWSGLMRYFPEPEVFIADGGSGFAKALREMHMKTRIQRCLVHVQRDILTCTTRHPRTEAGQELYRLAIRLPHLTTLKSAQEWIVDVEDWMCRYESFLAQRTRYENGKIDYTPQELGESKRNASAFIEVRPSVYVPYLSSRKPRYQHSSHKQLYRGSR